MGITYCDHDWALHLLQWPLVFIHHRGRRGHRDYYLIIKDSVSSASSVVKLFSAKTILIRTQPASIFQLTDMRTHSDNTTYRFDGNHKAGICQLNTTGRSELCIRDSGYTMENNWCPTERFDSNRPGKKNVWKNNGPQVADSIKYKAGRIKQD